MANLKIVNENPAWDAFLYGRIKMVTAKLYIGKIFRFREGTYRDLQHKLEPYHLQINNLSANGRTCDPYVRRDTDSERTRRYTINSFNRTGVDIDFVVGSLVGASNLPRDILENKTWQEFEKILQDVRKDIPDATLILTADF